MTGSGPVTEENQPREPNHMLIANVRGSLKAGKLAHITVLDRNLLRIAPERVLETDVDLTMVDGKVVFERNGAGVR